MAGMRNQTIRPPSPPQGQGEIPARQLVGRDPTGDHGLGCGSYQSIGDSRLIAMNQRLADRLTALGHFSRLEILGVLAARGTCVSGEVVEVIQARLRQRRVPARRD
jgi:hypothetical protein